MIPKLRRDIGNCFTSGKIKTEAGVSHISNRTVRHYLNKHGYYFRHSRKKGPVTAKDRLNHVKFAKKVLSRLTSEFWTEGISFYLDGVGFVHKTKPHDQARNHGSMAYRLYVYCRVVIYNNYSQYIHSPLLSTIVTSATSLAPIPLPFHVAHLSSSAKMAL